MTKQELDRLMERYNKLLREKERQQIRYEEAVKKLDELGVDKENLGETINELDSKISEMETKLETNMAKIDKRLTMLEEKL